MVFSHCLTLRHCCDSVSLQVITTINIGKLFYCGVFHPDDDKQNVLMSGCGDKKIYQFDLNSGDVEQVGAWVDAAGNRRAGCGVGAANLGTCCTAPCAPLLRLVLLCCSNHHSSVWL